MPKVTKEQLDYSLRLLTREMPVWPRSVSKMFGADDNTLANADTIYWWQVSRARETIVRAIIEGVE
jgi:hypothetical protein